MVGSQKCILRQARAIKQAKAQAKAIGKNKLNSGKADFTPGAQKTQELIKRKIHKSWAYKKPC
jgi:hypothetical protein